MEWGTVLSLAMVFVVGCGFVARQIKRCENRLSKRIDQLIER